MTQLLNLIKSSSSDVFYSTKKAVLDHVRGVAIEQPRSIHWFQVRNKYLKEHNHCAFCDTTEHLEVHHIKPFHLYPELELDTDNFITLCEGNTKCHLLQGHFDNWRTFNSHIVADCIYRDKIVFPPLSKS
jgi:hypothetical protein